MAALPLILFPGVAADARLFEPQLAEFPTLRVPSWIDPVRGESLRAYAARFGRVIDPGVPCIVGGASFGGVVAQEMAGHLRAVACVLIGSIHSPAELPWRWRVLRPLSLLGPEGLRVVARIGSRLRLPWLGRGWARRLRKLAGADANFVRWAMCA